MFWPAVYSVRTGLTPHVAVRVAFRAETRRVKVEKAQGQMQSETGRECGSSLPL